LSAKEICQVLHKEDTEVLGRKDGEAGLIYTARRYDAEGRRASLVLGDGTREGRLRVDIMTDCLSVDLDGVSLFYLSCRYRMIIQHSSY
jgi:hypothetical protein